MWEPGKKPEVNDDLMEDWLQAVVKHQKAGLTRESLRSTMTELVNHLSGGARMVVEAERNLAVERAAYERMLSRVPLAAQDYTLGKLKSG